MRQHVAVFLLVFFSFLIAGCSSYRGNAYPHQDLTVENWRQHVQRTTAGWEKGASNWFLTGDPSLSEEKNWKDAYASNVSTMQVRVAPFQNIVVNAPFQVQIFAAQGHNSVFVYGPNQQVQNVSIATRGNTLYINTATNMPKGAQTQNVIIRIGIVNLSCIENNGMARIEARGVRSNLLRIYSNGSGNIYLSGPVNLRYVRAINSGCVSVFGAITPVLDILTSGRGSVNVSGNVGVRSIIHKNAGNINLVGVNSDGVRINAYGNGRISLYGIMNLREIIARDNMQVFAMNVDGVRLNIYASDNACVGVAGCTGDFYVTAANNARVFARDLCARDAYIRATYHAHVNVTASNKIYAAATQSSSIYFFGKPEALSQFVSENGAVIPVWPDGGASCRIPNVLVYPKVADHPRVQRYHYKDRPVRVTPLNAPPVSVGPAPEPETQYIFRRKRTQTYTTSI